MVNYQSTRGWSENLSFEDTVISGLAPDKGLYLPDSTTLENLSLLTQEDLSYEDFVKRVPIRDYEALKPYVDRMVAGENNILWKGKPLYFAKTSELSGKKSITDNDVIDFIKG